MANKYVIGLDRGAVGFADTKVNFAGTIADPAAVDTLVDTADTALDAAKVLTAALETDTIAVDASVDGNVVLTAALATDATAADAAVDVAIAAEPNDADVITELGVLQGQGASPTEAQVDILQGVWDTFKTAFDAYNVTVADAKVLTAALETDAIAADADVDATKVLSAALETDAIAADAAVDTTVTASQAAQVASAALGTGTSDNMNVMFDAAAGWTRQELILALEVIEGLLATGQGPDADAKFPII